MKIVSAVLRDIFDMLIGILLFGILFTVFCKMLASPMLFSDAASEEVGVERARSPVEASCAETEEIPEEKSPCVLTVYREGDGPVPAWYRPDEPMAVEWTDEFVEGINVLRKDVGYLDPWLNELLTDSRGATAERWEIEECIRELMLEAGGESAADIREHAAVYCKRLLYTQTVGGFDDWGTTLYGVIHSHGFLETYPYIWTERAEPTDEVREIFWDVWYNGYDTDFRVQNFRSGYYADWSIPAYQIGESYYGINPWQDFSMFE